MKLTIESMTYGTDGLAHADNGKAVFVQGAVAGDTVEAEIVQDGKSFMRARTTEILEPSPDRIQPPCPFVGICGGCSWGNLSRSAQLAAKEQNLRSTLERIGKFTPEQVNDLVQPIRHTKDDWGYRNKIELEPTLVNGRVRLGMHGIDPSKIVTVDSCPLFDKRFPKALKSVVGALNYLSGSHDLGLERVGIRASRRTKALEVALWTPTGSFPRSQVSRVLADAAHPTSVVRVMSKGEKKARRVSKVEMLAGEGSWTENIADGQMRLSAPSFFQVNTKGAEILIELVMDALDPQEDELDLATGTDFFAAQSVGPAAATLLPPSKPTVRPCATCAVTSRSTSSTTSTSSAAMPCASSPTRMPMSWWSTRRARAWRPRPSTSSPARALAMSPM